jgi:hypothetical protein
VFPRRSGRGDGAARQVPLCLRRIATPKYHDSNHHSVIQSVGCVSQLCRLMQLHQPRPLPRLHLPSLLHPSQVRPHDSDMSTPDHSRAHHHKPRHYRAPLEFEQRPAAKCRRCLPRCPLRNSYLLRRIVLVPHKSPDAITRGVNPLHAQARFLPRRRDCLIRPAIWHTIQSAIRNCRRCVQLRDGSHHWRAPYRGATTPVGILRGALVACGQWDTVQRYSIFDGHTAVSGRGV